MATATATTTLPLTVEELAAAAAGPPFYAEDARRIALAWNASLPEPSPVCPRCEYFFEPGQRGDLFPRWCCNCEADLLYRCLQRLVRRFGRKATKAKLFALVRTSSK
jgi:hypothetical protein